MTYISTPLHNSINRFFKLILLVIFLSLVYALCSAIKDANEPVQVKDITIEYYCLSCGEKKWDDVHFQEQYIKKPFANDSSKVVITNYEICDDCLKCGKAKETEGQVCPSCGKVHDAKDPPLFVKIVVVLLVMGIVFLAFCGVIIWLIDIGVTKKINRWTAALSRMICSWFQRRY